MSTAQILPIVRAAEFAHLPELKLKVENGHLVNNTYIDALSIRIEIGGKELRAMCVEYYPAPSNAKQGFAKAARVSFKGARGGFLVGHVYFDKPNEIIYNRYGVETNNKAAKISGVTLNS
jgi:hypothetical protein